jgi:hypothetical protein
MPKRFVGQTFFANCWLAFFWLLVRGRLCGMVLCYRWPVPPHVMGITHQGHVVHFKSLKD